MKKLYITGILTAILLGLPGVVHAAGSVPDVTVVPFLQTVQILAQDKTKALDLTLSNNTKQTQSFKLSVLDFGALDESGGVAFASSDASTLIKKYGLSSWLKLESDSITLKPGQKAKIEAMIVNEDSLSPGGHYAAVVASLDSKDSPKGSQIDIKQQLSALIMATKIGGEKYDLSLDKTEFQTSWWRLPSSVTLRFKNPGNVQVIPRGTVKLIAPGGKVVSQGIINEGSGYVLPETFRRLTTELTSVARPRWWPATYSMQVSYRYDGLDVPAVKTFTVRFINLPALLVAGTLLAVIVIVAMKIIKKRRR